MSLPCFIRSLRRDAPAAAFAGLTLATIALPARADAIDGDWCSGKGRRISIAGPSVVSPAGVAMQGEYSRHSFRFVMPEKEPDAGAPVDMVLRGETAVQVRIGSDDAAIWRRCPAGIS